MAPYKLYEEPIQKYRELNTIDWTPTFTIRPTPTRLGTWPSLTKTYNKWRVNIGPSPAWQIM